MSATVTSRDGTRIAYDRIDSGPPVVLVDGAFCYRGFGPMPALAKELAGRHTVFYFDRRGRGDSGDTTPYAVEREIEDVAAICALTGEPPALYGISSGAMLALRVAAAVPIRRLAIYELPLQIDGTHVADPPDFRERIDAHLAAGRRGDAVKAFMKVVGVPGFGMVMMRLIPGVWRKLCAVVHTLPYDFACIGDAQRGGPLPDELRRLLAAVPVPTRVLVGGKAAPWMKHACEVVARLVPGAEHGVIPGQTHNVSAKAMAPELARFFGG